MEEFIERRATAFVESCSNAKLVGWKEIGTTQIGGVAYDAQFSAVCKNPFKLQDTWYVNAWLKKSQSDNVEEELWSLLGGTHTSTTSLKPLYLLGAA